MPANRVANRIEQYACGQRTRINESNGSVAQSLRFANSCDESFRCVCAVRRGFRRCLGDLFYGGPEVERCASSLSSRRKRVNHCLVADLGLSAVLDRFQSPFERSHQGAEGVIGEMDALYSSWGTEVATGFNDEQIAALERIVPCLALAIKSVSLVRMTRTLVETYLGSDAGQRVLRGRIVRGIAEQIDAVVWFSDLRGFTRIADTEPEQVVSLLNDYSDVIVSTIQEHGGDVLKLIGDGTLAIFTAENRAHSCSSALAAAIAAREGVAKLNNRRSAEKKPTTDMYLGLHVGEVFYGNVGSRERLDFTVLGPAVNEASRIAAMCRSVDQPFYRRRHLLRLAR